MSSLKLNTISNTNEFTTYVQHTPDNTGLVEILTDECLVGNAAQHHTPVSGRILSHCHTCSQHSCLSMSHHAIIN